MGKALGAVATDIDNDGRMDLFVANDTVENFLFANRRHGWEEMAFGAQVALSSDGWPRSGMGVDAADIDGDGRRICSCRTWIRKCSPCIEVPVSATSRTSPSEASLGVPPTT